MRLVGNENPQFANRAHFFSAAAEAMRRILIDKARRKRANGTAATSNAWRWRVWKLPRRVTTTNSWP